MAATASLFDMRALGIEYITVFGLPPVEFVNLAADLGCAHIGTGLAPMPYNPHGYLPWSLIQDRALRLEVSAALAMQTVVEFGPRLAVANLPTALAAVRHVHQPNCRLLIDTMHLVRSGSGAADIATLDPDLIGYVQLCDAPLVSRFCDYAEEAKFERLVPGAGELPLLDILAALPSDRVIGLEVPQRSLAEAGVGPRERLGQCVAGALNLFRR